MFYLNALLEISDLDLHTIVLKYQISKASLTELFVIPHSHLFIQIYGLLFLPFAGSVWLDPNELAKGEGSRGYILLRVIIMSLLYRQSLRLTRTS